MRIDLTELAKRATNQRRRRATTLRDIIPPATLATDLYRAVYLPVVTAWSRTAERVIAEYERTLASTINDAYALAEDGGCCCGRANGKPFGIARGNRVEGSTPSRLFTTDAPSDITSTLDQAEAELSRLVLLLRPSLSDWTIRVEKWWRGKWIGAVLAASKVDLSTLLTVGDVRETLETILGWNVDLVQDVSRQTRQRISNAVYDGLRNRTPARDVAKQIREATGMARDRSQRIAADQLTKLTSSLASERRRQAGLTKWEWRSSHKLHFRPEHAARDGKVYSDDDAPQDLPGQLPYCGCRERAVLTFD